MNRLGGDDLRRLSEMAAAAPRRRMNRNLHERPDDPVQRLLNALEPGTYVRPHRHASPPKWELFALLAGAVAVLLFDDDGTVTERVDLGGEAVLAEIPAGRWHSLAALAPGSVVLEVKPGPYEPLSDKDFAAWAPAEGDPAAAALEAWLRTAKRGERARR